MHMRTNWDDYLYFLKVARLGSLKGASKSLGVNHSTVLRRINALEEKLDARLFERLHSGYVLTESGKDIFNQIDHIEEEFLSIERTILGRDIRYEGKIKLSTTDTLGQYWLPPYIKKFKQMYPGILLDIDINLGHTDLTKREADVVISAINRHPDYMIGKALSPLTVKLYASKEYIAQNGKPNNPEALAEHEIIILNENLGRLGFNEWLKGLVPKSSIALSCSMFTGLCSYARQGLGVVPLPFYVGDVYDDLVCLMDIPEQFHSQIWILTHPDLKKTQRIKAFMQFMHSETGSSKNK